MSVQKTGASPTGERSDKARTQSPEESLHSLTSMPPRASNGRFMRVVSASPAPVDPGALPEDRFLDREISWLQFNERVLQLAADEAVPLLERAGYLAIFASNLDEFFMVRVAGLKRRIATGLAVRSASGLEPREVLEENLTGRPRPDGDACAGLRRPGPPRADRGRNRDRAVGGPQRR